jgi:hypothetical protein
MMSLDDALTLAGQVLADYEVSGLADAPGAGGIWPGRLAHALRDLSAAAAAWYASPVSDPSAAALGTAVRQIEDGAARVEAEAARLDRAAAALAGRRVARPGAGGPGRVRDAVARIAWAWAARATRGAPEPGAVVLSAADADTVWQALADAAAWHAGQGDCADCPAGQCADPGRHAVIAAGYAALRARLGGVR